MCNAEVLDLGMLGSLAAQANLLNQSKRSHVKLLHATWSELMKHGATETAQADALRALEAAKVDSAAARQKCLELSAAARPG